MQLHCSCIAAALNCCIAVALQLHCCCIAVALQLHCSCIVVALQLHCSCIAVAFQVHCIVVAVQLHCSCIACLTVALLLHCNCSCILSGGLDWKGNFFILVQIAQILITRGPSVRKCKMKYQTVFVENNNAFPFNPNWCHMR